MGLYIYKSVIHIHYYSKYYSIHNYLLVINELKDCAKLQNILLIQTFKLKKHTDFQIVDIQFT